MENKSSENLSNNMSKSNNNKLDELTRLLADKANAKKSTNADALTSSLIATKLFSRMPANFLSTKTTADLVEITETVLPLINKILTSRAEQIILTRSSSTTSSLYIAQGDKPFIINTVTEVLREANINMHFVLHPIYTHSGFRISVVYIEFDTQSNDKLTFLEKRIHDCLQDLKLSTEDFTNMLVKTETLARVLGNPKYRSPIPSAEQLEIAEFLRWLTDAAYIFLGYADWKISNDKISPKPESSLGILKNESPNAEQIISEIKQDIPKLLNSGDVFLVSKLTSLSNVQRFNRLQSICLIECGSDGQPQTVHVILGLFTSKALTQESSSIPVIKRKLKLLVEAEDLYENSYDFKTTVNIIDSMPKDEALRLDLPALKEIINTIVGIQQKNETRVSLRFDSNRRGATILVIIPRDRFNSRVRDRLQTYLEEAFGAGSGSSEYHLDLSNKPFARMYFYVPLAQGVPPKIDLLKLEKDIAQLSQTWQNYLEDQIRVSLPTALKESASDILSCYSEAFPEDYQALYTVNTALNDIVTIENLVNSHKHFAFGYEEDRKGSSGSFQLVIYNLEHPLTLSLALPVMENIGLEVLSESSTIVKPLRKSQIYIHRYRVKPKSNTTINDKDFNTYLAPALEAVFLNEIENDHLNALISNAKLSHYPVAVLRAYCNLLWQVSAFATKQAMFACLATHSDCAKILWEMFAVKFDPQLKLSIEERRDKFTELYEKLTEALRKVTDINSDRILRSLTQLIEHSLRTSFFKSPNCFAIKLHSQKIAVLPNPKPLFEIFVYAVDIQGTHLRMSKVARGGIRWSERYEDFRSEVLGLVKTQKIKNAVIVPSGAKGGFIVHNLPSDTAELKKAVQNSYRKYISSLLELADNIIENKVVHPTGIVIHDEPDPYFVVAADKGTATFSDTANSLAVEDFNFWLGDAFASGGSQGYDHKLYGITAKGAWECVLRHFRDIGIDYENADFTAIGIGDMSGDVFGNGLLLSRRFKLLSAFNHKHIFIDPNPDAEKSFKERERLFNLPGSQWSDYKPELISKGGGVFNRYAKEIELNPEIRTALGIASDVPNVINGEELIHQILKAPCDLLWNGGIGTYVKSEEESHADVNDGTNDRVRINATELRAKVVGEGGNLGFTQRARLEYSQNGGRLNTDAIDNSAGVDLSDHEVNIKILLGAIEKQKLLTRDARNALLKEVAIEVTEHVLAHNKNHALALTLGVQRSQRNIVYFRSLIRELHKLGYINRSLENLPDDEDLLERAQHKQGLMRSELAVCLAGVKMYLKDVITESSFINEARLEPYLVEYFPKLLQERYPTQIKEHQLAKNIIATQITNDLVDSMGITFVHRLCSTNGIEPLTVIKYAVASQLLLGTKELLTSIQTLDTFSGSATFISLRREINTALRHVTSWFFQHHPKPSLNELMDKYQSAYNKFIANIESNLEDEQAKLYQTRLASFKTLGLSAEISSRLSALVLAEHILESLWIANSTSTAVKQASSAFACVEEKLGVQTLLKLAGQVTTLEKWDSELIVGATQEIRKSVSALAGKFVSAGISTTEIPTALSKLTGYQELLYLQQELIERGITPSALAVFAKRLEMLLV